MSQIIADPRHDQNDRYAGVSKVQSSGVVAAARDGGARVVGDHQDIPSYVVSFIVAPTVAMDVVDLFLSTGKILRLRRIVLVNPGSATTPATIDIQLGTVGSAAGSGGAAATVLAVDASARVTGVAGGPDSTVGIVARTGDTTQAAGFVAVYGPVATVTVPGTAAAFTPLTIYDARDERFKALTISSNTNGISLRTPAVGAGAAGFRGYAEFTVDDA